MITPSRSCPLPTATAWQNLYCKHDGSLDDGFEMVTHPHDARLPSGRNAVGSHLTEGRPDGVTRAIRAGTCGPRSRQPQRFRRNRSTAGCRDARILYFFEKNWEELLKFSRRTQYQLDQWAARYGYKDQPKSSWTTPRRALTPVAIPASTSPNKNTIEFRIFRGTLKDTTRSLPHYSSLTGSVMWLFYAQTRS